MSDWLKLHSRIVTRIVEYSQITHSGTSLWKQKCLILFFQGVSTANEDITESNYTSSYLWWALIGASVACFTTTLGSFLISFSLLCWYHALYTRNPVPSFWKDLYFLFTIGTPSSEYSEYFCWRGFSTEYWLGLMLSADLLFLSNSIDTSWKSNCMNRWLY